MACDVCDMQETRWLKYMLTQLSSTYGDVGDSVTTVDKLITEHTKFVETAKVRGVSCNMLTARHNVSHRNRTNMGVACCQLLGKVASPSNLRGSPVPPS